MAFEYFLYDTNFNNTLVDRGVNSFAPLPPNTGEIHINYNIPQIQPLYLYRESGSTIILNDDQTIDDYLNATTPPTGEDSVDQDQFTGYTATTEIQINNKVEWEGIYSGATHLKNDMVSDNGWTMIANKDTSDRPAPQAVGEPFFLYSPLQPTIVQSTAKQITFGMQYSSSVPYWVNGYRINVIAGNDYEVILIEDAGGVNEAKFINNFHADINGWREFSIVPRPINSGTTYQILSIVNEPDPTPLIVNANYDYKKPNNSGTPSTGEITHANKLLDSILIHKTDSDSTNREAMLTGLTTGDQITIASQIWSIQAVTNQSTYVDFTVAPARQSNTTGVVDVKFETTAPAVLSYGNEFDFWSGNTNINGVFALDVNWEDAVIDNNQYGVDIFVQEANVSPDWDFVSTAGDGGGGSTINSIWGTIDGDITNQVDLQLELSGKTNIVTGATGNVPIFLGDGNIEDSGFSIADLTGGTTGGTGGTDIYVSGATLVGDSLNLHRSEGQPDVTADLSAYGDAISQNASDIQLVSGETTTNASNISDNTTNIGIVSGITDQNTSDITQNASDIQLVSGVTTQNTGDINYISGITDTKIDKVTGATENNIALFDTNGEIKDDGYSITAATESIKFQSIKGTDQLNTGVQDVLINWDIPNPIENTYYSFDTALGELTFLQDGWYDISYVGSIGNIGAGNSRSEAETWLQEDLNSTGFTNINGSRSIYYIRQQNFGSAGSSELLKQYNVGDKIRITARRTSGSATLTILGDSLILKVIKSERSVNIIKNNYIITGGTAYGREYQLSIDLTSTSTSSVTPIVKVTMTTTNLPNGTYKITSAWLGRHLSASNDMIFDVTLNGTPQGTVSSMNIEPKDITSYYPFTRILYLTLSGVNTIELRFWAESSTTTISDATIELIRVE